MNESATIFTDGASKGNPGPGGWGAVAAFGDTVRELGGGEMLTTNNRMELTAAIEALSFITQNPQVQTYEIYSDSTYLINGITKWVESWKLKGWIGTQKKPVENRNLWEKLDALVSGLSIQWHKVAGHADTPGNARADEIASAFAEGVPPRLFSGSHESYTIDLSIVGARSSVRSKGAYSYVSLVDGVIQTHQTWKECEARVKGRHAARYKKAFSAEDEARLIQEYSQ